MTPNFSKLIFDLANEGYVLTFRRYHLNNYLFLVLSHGKLKITRILSREEMRASIIDNDKFLYEVISTMKREIDESRQSN